MNHREALAAVEELTRLEDGNPVIVSRDTYHTTEYGVAWQTAQNDDLTRSIAWDSLSLTSERIFEYSDITEYIASVTVATEPRKPTLDMNTDDTEMSDEEAFWRYYLGDDWDSSAARAAHMREQADDYRSRRDDE